MEVSTTTEGAYHIIAIKGELDANSAVTFDGYLTTSIKANHPKILIDCTGLKYISSAGIGAFTSKIEDCEQLNIALVLFGVNETVQSVFSILGLDQVLTITTTKEMAKTKADDVA